MGIKSLALGFSLAPGVGPKRFQNLLKAFGSAKDAWDGSEEKFKLAGIGKVNFAKLEAFRKIFDISEYVSKLKKARVEFIPFESKEYPDSLRKLVDPPIGLFAKGNKKLLIEPRIIGVVGARKITSYGREVTENLVSELCSAGFVIASGMALGVDGVAHKAAIDNHGSTIAVLGCGVDCPYPRENEELYEEILDSKGLVISEYPLGMPANQGTFPARNRIIAGISSSILITEAAEDSGSLITAGHAVEQGKPVFAVPGPISSRMSDGTAKLIKQGGLLITSVRDILENFQLPITNFQSMKKLKNFQLNKNKQKILKALENEELIIDEIAKLTKIPITKLSIILSEMEIKGLIKNMGGKFSQE